MSKGVWMTKWYHEDDEKYHVDRNKLVQIVLGHYPKAGLLIGIHDGNPPPTKDHDHWFLGWKKDMPEYEDFKKFMDDVGFQCPPSAQKAKCYHPNAQRDYLMHQSEKAIKDGKIPYDESHILEFNWLPAEYMTKSQKVAEERGENPFRQIYEYLFSTDVRSVSHLIHLAMKDHPEWLYWIHLDSAKYGRFIRDQHDTRLETAEAQCDEYKTQIDAMRGDINAMRVTIQNQKSIISAYQAKDPEYQEMIRKRDEERAKIAAAFEQNKAEEIKRQQAEIKREEEDYLDNFVEIPLTPFDI